MPQPRGSPWADSTASAPSCAFDTIANIAIGVAPWGPFAAAAAAGARSWLDHARTVRLAEDARLEAPAALEGLVLVVGKDLHRHPFAVTAIEALRAVRDDVVTVDMGWPSEDRAYVDIATFGASRLAGAALLELLAPRAVPARAETP